MHNVAPLMGSFDEDVSLPRFWTLRAVGAICRGRYACCEAVVMVPSAEPVMKEKKSTDAYPYASGGWGSLKAVTQILTREHVALKDGAVLAKQNKPDGFMCVSCSWAK